MPNEVARITLLVAHALEQVGVPYAVGGSLQSVYVISPEDTILAKLEWYRLGGEVSERQWRDVLGILKVRAGELDLDYLRTWAQELQVTDLLERALNESEVFL